MPLIAPVDHSGSAAADGSIFGAVLFLVFGLLFSYAGYAMLRPATLRLDALTRTYLECRGWWPWRKETHGSWDDISQVALHTYSVHGKGTTLFLHWHEAGRAPVALHTSTAQEAQGYRQVIAQLLGIPYLGEDGRLAYPPGAARRVPAKTAETPAEQAGVSGTTTPPSRSRQNSKARLVWPVLLLLTLLNSYGGGLTVVRQWRDEAGGRGISSNSLWKNDLIYVDAQGHVSESLAAYTPFSSSTRKTGSFPERATSGDQWSLSLGANAETALNQARQNTRPSTMLLPPGGSKNATHRFQYYYNYAPRGERYWLQLSPTDWQERYDTGQITTLRILERTTVGRDPGVTAEKEDGTGTVVFIPDKGSHRMHLRFHFRGQQHWQDLGEMTHIE